MNASHPQKGALVYAVDDLPPVLDLYVLLLESIGCTVAAFHDRAVALASLAAEQREPDLLITDYCGGRIPVGEFMRLSTALHPRLQILMASGLWDAGLRTGGVRPDMFIQKPFTNEEFTRAVETALVINRVRRQRLPRGQGNSAASNPAKLNANDPDGPTTLPGINQSPHDSISLWKEILFVSCCLPA